MKNTTRRTKAATPEKPVREPHISCYQTNYSPGALAMMEQATGQRITQLVPPVAKVPVQAVDAE